MLSLYCLQFPREVKNEPSTNPALKAPILIGNYILTPEGSKAKKSFVNILYQELLLPVEKPLYLSDEKSTTVEK